MDAALLRARVQASISEHEAWGAFHCRSLCREDYTGELGAPQAALYSP